MAEKTLSEEYLTKSFTAFAKKQGWPDEVISQMQVVFDGKNINFEYPSELDDTVFNLEYGHINKLCQPAIRNWTASLGDAVTNYVAEKFINDLSEKGVF